MAGTGPDCFVCRKHRGETDALGVAIYEDALLYADHAAILPDADTAYLGYLMLEPKRHVPGLDGLNDEEAAALGRMAARLSRALKEVVGAEHVYAFVLGHHVPHLHVHLVARYSGAPREYWGVHVDEWPGAPRGDAAAIAELCDRLRRYLSVHS
jgi:histidine triad (HIT) family protein